MAVRHAMDERAAAKPTTLRPAIGRLYPAFACYFPLSDKSYRRPTWTRALHTRGEDSMNLQTRVVNILTKPGSEWPVIAAESTDVVSLYRDYIAILAAIPAVCKFLGCSLMGMPLIGTLGFGFALRAG